MLEEKTCQAVLRHVAELWGYSVRLLERDALTDETIKTHEITTPPR
jgi:spore cortex formation protein SpoVR/YcgB (stage V sporulation)